MKWLIILLMIGSAQANTLEDVATSPETFAVCKIADVASTAYLLERGLAVEANPVVRALLVHGYAPLIAISIGLYYFLKEVNNPVATGTANAITCGVAVHNLLLIP